MRAGGFAPQPVVKVEQPARVETDHGTVVSAFISVGSTRHQLWYRVSDGRVSAGAETYLLATLLPAMVLGAPLHAAGPVSPRLLETVPIIQDVFSAWDRTFRRVPIEAGAAEPAGLPRPRGIGCFFSAGTDSWYSLVKHRDEISHLIFIHGYDISLERRTLRDRASRVIREIAAELHKGLIEVETNLHEFSDRYVGWEFYHGTAMASVAHLLSPQFRRIYVASSNTYAQLHPWGSHPILEPLWSTDALELVHDGCEVTKTEKLAHLASCDLEGLVLKTLRVCWQNPQEVYNCGRCVKCLVTMARLRMLGVLEHCTTFDRPLELRALSRVALPEHYRPYLRLNVEALERSGSDPALARAMRHCLHGRYHRGIWRLARGVRNRFRSLLNSFCSRH